MPVTSAAMSAPSPWELAHVRSESVREATYLGMAFIAATAGSPVSAYGQVPAKIS
ncbi:hypothetical protein [Streptomyces niveus]|uniref:hypothetical protein n=1 Tax=Streptomyces niveus TaxID=193462 RepID=UPI0033F7D16F